MSGLGACEEPLAARYDVAMLDLDGVVYVGPDPVPDAPAHLAAAREAGMTLAFVTNNASRPPATVARHLTDLGVPADSSDVVTSAQAAARLIAREVPPEAAVFVIGGEGLVEALAEHGLRAVQSVEDDPRAVVSGYHPDLRWRTVIDGAILVRQGLPWVASNTDATVPTPHGPGPGNGVLVRAVAEFAGTDPVVAGKPQPPLMEETLRRVGGDRPLVVGDRLDTDIEGAISVGYDSLLVMTGVSGLADLVAAAPDARPTYVAGTLAGLLEPHPLPVAEPLDTDHSQSAGLSGTTEESEGVTRTRWRLGGWESCVDEGSLVVTGEGSVGDWWRLVSVTSWTWRDATDEVVGVEGLAVPTA